MCGVPKKGTIILTTTHMRMKGWVRGLRLRLWDVTRVCWGHRGSNRDVIRGYRDILQVYNRELMKVFRSLMVCRDVFGVCRWHIGSIGIL